MNVSKIGSWIVTDAGKKFCFYLAGTTSVGVLCAHFLPHTILLNQYKNLVHLYKSGIPEQISPVLEKRFQKALDLLEIDPMDKHLYQPFLYCGFDTMSAGSSYSKFGVIVGLPANFTYENTEMVDKTKIKANEETIVWESEDGQKLLNSLVTSENAQLYAMAREIRYRQTPKPLLDTFFATTSCLLVYTLSSEINTRFNFHAKPRGLRLVMYSLVGLFSLGLYVMCKDVTQLHYEGKIDTELKQKNKLFAEGGREYYTKLLERNKAIRNLMGKEGERLYSVLGNENHLFRNKHLPLFDRKLFFEEPLMN